MIINVEATVFGERRVGGPPRSPLFRKKGKMVISTGHCLHELLNGWVNFGGIPCTVQSYNSKSNLLKVASDLPLRRLPTRLMVLRNCKWVPDIGIIRKREPELYKLFKKIFSP